MAPALWAAALVLAIGAWIVWGLDQRLQNGSGSPSVIILAGCITVCVAGSLVIVAFARYQFTHLWKHPDQVFRKTKKVPPAAVRNRRG